MPSVLRTVTISQQMTMLFEHVCEHSVFKNTDLSLITVCIHAYLYYLRTYISLLCNSGRTMGQEWRLYDVGGTRSSVSGFQSEHLNSSDSITERSMVPVF